MRILELVFDEQQTDPLQFISFVEKPAIEVDFIKLSSANKLTKLSIDDERRIVTGPVLYPDQLIERVDERGAYFLKPTKEAIEKLAFRTIKSISNRKEIVNIEHAVPVSLDKVYLIESFISNEMRDDKRFNLPMGTWFVSFKVEDDDLWTEIKSGKLRGFSIEGLLQMKELELSVYTTDEEDEIFKKYNEVVNMSYSELKDWSENECSKEASLDRDPINRNLELLQLNKDKWTTKHYRWANKTIGFLARMKESGVGDIVCGKYSKRDISLKNWAYDPNKQKLTQLQKFINWGKVIKK